MEFCELDDIMSTIRIILHKQNLLAASGNSGKISCLETATSGMGINLEKCSGIEKLTRLKTKGTKL